jgi:hypothetical protein
MQAKPVYKKDHDGTTCIPLFLLKEIVRVIGFDPNSKQSGPDGETDHTVAKGLEKTIYKVLGKDYLEWESKLSSRDNGYDNQELARKVYQCFRPIMSKDMVWIHGNAIRDALSVYEQDDNDFACYGPFTAGFIFEQNMLQKVANKYAFIFSTTTLLKNTKVNYDDPIKFEGSHWVVLYIDIVTNVANYYDSFGTSPSEPIRKSIISIISVLQTKMPSITLNVTFPTDRQQKDGTECGVYVTHFVAERLRGTTMQQFNKLRFSPEFLRKLRDFYWTITSENLFSFKQ